MYIYYNILYEIILYYMILHDTVLHYLCHTCCRPALVSCHIYALAIRSRSSF